MSDPTAMNALTCDEVREMAGAFVLEALDVDIDAQYLRGAVDAFRELPKV